MKKIALLLTAVIVFQCALAQTDSESNELIYSFAENHALILSIDENDRPMITNYAGNENHKLKWHQKHELSLSFAQQQLQNRGDKRNPYTIVNQKSLEQDLSLLLESLLQHYNTISFQISHIEADGSDRYSLCFPQSGIPQVGTQFCYGFEDGVESTKVAPLLKKLMQNLPGNIASGLAPSPITGFRYSPEKSNEDGYSPSNQQEIRQHMEWINEQLRGICGRETPGSIFVPDGGGEFCYRSGVESKPRNGQTRVWGYYKHRDGSFDKAFHEAWFPLTND